MVGGGRRGDKNNDAATNRPPEGGVANAIFVKLCVQFILQALIAGMIHTLFYYSLWYVLSHPSHVRGLGLGLAF